MQLILEQGILDAMRAHVESCLPMEGCGLLAGVGNIVQQVLAISNQADSPARFRMDQLEQIRAFEQIEADGLELLGIFHSHPAGPEIASATDISEAAYPVVQIILSKQEGIWKARGFWFEDGKTSDVELVFAAGSSPNRASHANATTE